MGDFFCCVGNDDDDVVVVFDGEAVAGEAVSGLDLGVGEGEGGVLMVAAEVAADIVVEEEEEEEGEVLNDDPPFLRTCESFSNRAVSFCILYSIGAGAGAGAGAGVEEVVEDFAAGVLSFFTTGGFGGNVLFFFITGGGGGLGVGATVTASLL